LRGKAPGREGGNTSFRKPGTLVVTDHETGKEMIQVPGFLLRRLYVRGSLQNAAGGFEFELKNALGSGYADRMLPLTLDGRELPLDHASFRQESGIETAFSAVDENTPFTLQMNKTVKIRVDGETLTPGAHKIGMSFRVRGIGTLSFDVNDVVD
jgi:hypothetical protein